MQAKYSAFCGVVELLKPENGLMAGYVSPWRGCGLVLSGGAGASILVMPFVLNGHLASGVVAGRRRQRGISFLYT